MQNSLYKLFEHKCVLEVCTHPSNNDKNPPSVFFLLPFLKSGCSEIPVRMTKFCTGELIDKTCILRFYSLLNFQPEAACDHFSKVLTLGHDEPFFSGQVM